MDCPYCDYKASSGAAVDGHILQMHRRQHELLSPPEHPGDHLELEEGALGEHVEEDVDLKTAVPGAIEVINIDASATAPSSTSANVRAPSGHGDGEVDVPSDLKRATAAHSKCVSRVDHDALVDAFKGLEKDLQNAREDNRDLVRNARQEVQKQKLTGELYHKVSRELAEANHTVALLKAQVQALNTAVPKVKVESEFL